MQLLKVLSILATILILATSCVHTPYTSKDERNLYFAMTGTAFDCATTGIALNSGRFEEVGPVYGDGASIGTVIAGKVALLGLAGILGEVFPEQRSLYFKIVGWSGFGAGAYNTYQMAR